MKTFYELETIPQVGDLISHITSEHWGVKGNTYIVTSIDDELTHMTNDDGVCKVKTTDWVLRWYAPFEQFLSTPQETK